MWIFRLTTSKPEPKALAVHAPKKSIEVATPVKQENGVVSPNSPDKCSQKNVLALPWVQKASSSYAPCTSKKISESPSKKKFAKKRVGRSEVKRVLSDVVQAPYFELLKNATPIWDGSNVQVFVRIRPLLPNEISLEGYKRCIDQDSARTLAWVGQPSMRFQFDNIACENIGQEELFEVSGLEIVEECLRGYNGCILSYGEARSGKSYTMLGDTHQQTKDWGIIPRVFKELFKRIAVQEQIRRKESANYSCKCSILGVTDDKVIDIIQPDSENLHFKCSSRGAHVENCTEVEVSCLEEVLNLLNQGIEGFNRSHIILTCVIECTWMEDSEMRVRSSTLKLADLAWPESYRLTNGTSIKVNRSLTVLGQVVNSLEEVCNGNRKDVPYRDSKLTHLLQDSLGGNCKTIFMVTVSPSSSCSMNTFNTLCFAQRAKSIRNHVFVNCGESIRVQNQSLTTKGLETAGGSSSESKGAAFMMGIENMKKILVSDTEQWKKLIKQREEDVEYGRMMLRLQSEKLQRLEAAENGLFTPSVYEAEETKACLRELQYLRSRSSTNRELTCLAMENLRLMEKLQKYHKLYDTGRGEDMFEEHQTLQIEHKQLAVDHAEVLRKNGQLQQQLEASEDRSRSNEEAHLKVISELKEHVKQSEARISEQVGTIKDMKSKLKQVLKDMQTQQQLFKEVRRMEDGHTFLVDRMKCLVEEQSDEGPIEEAEEEVLKLEWTRGPERGFFCLVCDPPKDYSTRKLLSQHREKVHQLRNHDAIIEGPKNRLTKMEREHSKQVLAAVTARRELERKKRRSSVAEAEANKKGKLEKPS